MKDKLRILVVDDDPNNVDILTKVLRRAGCYELQTATSGEKCLAAMETFRPANRSARHHDVGTVRIRNLQADQIR